MTVAVPEEHPFAQYVRTLGKGQRSARSLTLEEARSAMGMLLDGQIEDTQLGAFLMLLRYREESAEELAGFVQAVRQRLAAPAVAVDLDWPSYAGKKRQLPWHLLAVRCLAQQGFRILLHGAGAHTGGRLYTEQLLALLDIPHCQSWPAVAEALDRQQLAFIPLQVWMPRLQQLINLRNILGVRSPIHSLVRMINPLSARCGLQSIFHPGYQETHRQAMTLLGDTAIVVKGDGGEIELNPGARCRLYGTAQGQAWTEEWPPLSSQRQDKPEVLSPEHLLAVWRGERRDDYGRLAVQATIALALRGLGQSREAAFSQAESYWQSRLQGCA